MTIEMWILLAVLIVGVVGMGTVIANLLIAALVAKLYTEYWKDITIKRRYEKEEKHG